MKGLNVVLAIIFMTLLFNVGSVFAEDTDAQNVQPNNCVDETSADYRLYTESANLVKDGEKSLLSGNYEAARICFQKAVESYANNTDAKVKLAWVLALQNKGDDALKILNPLLKDNPTWPAALLAKAVALAYKNDEKGSKEVFESLFAAEPKEIRHYLFYANYTMKFGLLKTADRLKKAFEQHPDWYLIGAKAGWLYYAAGKYDDAYKLLVKSTAHIEKPQGFVLPLVISAVKSKNVDNAKAELNKYKSNHPWINGAIGAMMYMSNNKKDGANLIESAAKSCKDIPALMYFKGVVLLDRGADREGADTIKAALSGDPQRNVLMLYVAANALERVKNKDFALDAYKRFCNITKTMGILPNVRKEAEQRMQQLIPTKKMKI